MPSRHCLAALTTLALAACSKQSTPIEITGSSTVYPFTKQVADQLVESNKNIPTPRLQETGTNTGIANFCAGPDAPDVLDASRRMTRAEFDKCQANKVGDIMEIPIGLDGVALAESNAGPKLSVTAADLYRALAATPMGKPNTAKTWHDVNPKLPAIAIKVLGPPPSSGTRDSFAALILEAGCIAAMPDAAAMRNAADPAKFDTTCHRIREDGVYQNAGENDNATVSALESNKDAVGLFGYSYLEQNAGRLRGVPIDGVTPEANTIASGAYKGARTLYIYVKKARLKRAPSLQPFLDLYTRIWVPDGPLAARGLIAMSGQASEDAANIVKTGEALTGDKLY